MQSIQVKHNIEVAHRLSGTPGKCENIHGHSMWVTLELYGEVNEKGLLADLDFGFVKAHFRDHLDSTYDHRLLLSQYDPWSRGLPFASPNDSTKLPGLAICEADPTTENISRWIGRWAEFTFGEKVEQIVCQVQETSVNFASWSNI